MEVSKIIRFKHLNTKTFSKDSKVLNIKKTAPSFLYHSLLRLCIIGMLLIITAFANHYDVHASVSSKRHQLEQARTQLRAVRKHVDIANVRERDLAQQLNRTNSSIKQLKNDIAYLNQSIESSRAEIRKMREELAALQKEHDSRQALLQRRLRDIYLNHDTSILTVIAGASSLSDLINQADFLSRVVESDEQLISSLRMEQETIRYKQREINDKYNRMLSYRGTLTQKRNSLESIRSKREELLEEVERKRKDYLLKKYELEDHTHELELEIQDMIRRYHQSRPSSAGSSGHARQGTGTMVWPTGGPITSDYGYRIHPVLGYGRMHTGIDIGSGYGQNIKAADAGTVIYSGWCGGYGNTIIIDHGRGVSTLYAHCSRLFVGKGENVNQGDAVASVGSTGMSTGPHLHFEVRVNGVPVNPWGYLR